MVVDNAHSADECELLVQRDGVDSGLEEVGMGVEDSSDPQVPWDKVDGVATVAVLTSFLKGADHLLQLAYSRHVEVCLVGSTEVRLGVHTDVVASDTQGGEDTYCWSLEASGRASRLRSSCQISSSLPFSTCCGCHPS